MKAGWESTMVNARHRTSAALRLFPGFHRNPTGQLPLTYSKSKTDFGLVSTSRKAQQKSAEKKMEVTVGLEPTKTGFAGQRLDHFGIATFEPIIYTRVVPKTVPKLPPGRLFTPILFPVSY